MADPPGPSSSSSSRRRRDPGRDPNPLFTLWLRQWRDEASGTPARGVYERALRSLARYPLPLPSGAAASLLQHFGPALCARLDQWLRRHRREQGLPPTPPRVGRGPKSLLAPPTRRPPREYRPLPRSGGHALLLTLHKSSEPLPEAELLHQARPLCLRPQALKGPGGALKTLLQRDLIQRSGCPPRYSLTPRGQFLAQRLADAALKVPPPPGGTQASGESPLLDGDENCPPPPPRPLLCDPELQFELHPGQFDIVLCADVTEANGRVPALLRGPLPLLLRPLPVGDFLWVARERDPPPGRPPRELVLDVVVERKTASDLGKSLMDGRYREQKFRLGRSGLRWPLYLLEEPQGGEHLPLPPPVLRQAAATTQVLDGFHVKETGGPRETAALLGVLGGQLERRHRDQVLRAWGGDLMGRGPPEPPGTPQTLLPFQRLREGGGKNQPQRVRDVFARQLLQLGGLSGGALGGVLGSFPTPHSLMAAYERCRDPQERETLLSSRGSLGPSLSRSLARLYSSPGALA